MRIFFLLTLGMVCLLVSKIQTKDFCESFAENEYEIDFGFTLKDLKNASDIQTEDYLIIHQNWWFCDHHDSNNSVSIVSTSNSSKFDPGYPHRQYMDSFECPVSNITIFYGFINKHDYSIDWKSYRGDGKFHLVNTTGSLFESDGFEPSFHFHSGYYIDEEQNIYQARKTFVSQQRVHESDGDIFERKYSSFHFIDRCTSIAKSDSLWNWQIANKTMGRKKIIAVFGPYLLKKVNSFIVLYKNGFKIEYCFQAVNSLNLSMDETCTNGIEVLIACNKYPDLPFWIVVIFGVIGIVTLVVFAICLWFNRHKWTKPGPKLRESHPFSKGSSNEVIHSTNDTTINSDPGLPIRSKNVSTVKTKKESEKTLMKSVNHTKPSKQSPKTRPKPGLSPTKKQTLKSSPK